MIAIHRNTCGLQAPCPIILGCGIRKEIDSAADFIPDYRYRSTKRCILCVSVYEFVYHCVCVRYKFTVYSNLYRMRNVVLGCVQTQLTVSCRSCRIFRIGLCFV